MITTNGTTNATTTATRLEDMAAVVARWLRYFFIPGDVTELRALGVSKPRFPKPHVEAGFYDYDHFDKLALDAITITRHAKGVYFTMNPLRHDILSRRANRIEPATTDFLAGDRDVLERRWMLVDLDPERDPLVSATADEKASAVKLADTVANYFSELIWPEPIRADSGNGYHLFYRVHLTNDEAATRTVKAILQWLGTQFDNPACKVDRKVYNASRIVKLPGTMARKGDDTESRPHRRGKLLAVPGVPDTDLFAGLAHGSASG